MLRLCLATALLASTLGVEQPLKLARPSPARAAPPVALAAVAATQRRAQPVPKRAKAARAPAASSRPPAPKPLSPEAAVLNSPLYMITQKEVITSLITYLHQSRLPIELDPDAPHELKFSRSQIEAARAEFEATLREGEQKQHTLCGLLGQRLLGRYYLQSVVVGELPRTRHRFELSQRVQPTTLMTETDLALGNRVLSQHRVMSNGQWVAPNLVASFVEYHPLDVRAASSAPGGEPHVDAQVVYKMISRIKAEQEIFNKVCDEIFDFDSLVRTLSREDKKLASLGHYVKDVFGIKLVVGTVEQARELQAAIEELQFTTEELAGVHVGSRGASRLRFIEVKDHLGSQRKGNSGWECIKSVFEWNGGLFEVQIQPLINYCLERERLTKQSHDAFKQKREAARDQVAECVPLFGFYRDILRTLFVEPPSCDGLLMPKFRNVRVLVSQ